MKTDSFHISMSVYAGGCV